MVWGSQHLGPMVLRALQLGEAEERRAERERQAVLEMRAGDRHARAIELALELHPELSVTELVMGGGMSHDALLAQHAAEMDSADRAAERRRSSELAERRANLPAPSFPARSHLEVLADAAREMDWRDGLDRGPVAS